MQSSRCAASAALRLQQLQLDGRAGGILPSAAGAWRSLQRVIAHALSFAMASLAPQSSSARCKLAILRSATNHSKMT